MLNRPSRRQFIRQTAAFGLTAGLLPGFAAASAEQLQACAAEPADPKWSRGLPIYQISPRFYSKDGSLASIKADLPRIKAMNVGIIYMMPIHPCTDNPDLNAQRKCNYFQAADYMAVNPVNGDSQLLMAARRRLAWLKHRLRLALRWGGIAASLGGVARYCALLDHVVQKGSCPSAAAARDSP